MASGLLYSIITSTGISEEGWELSFHNLRKRRCMKSSTYMSETKKEEKRKKEKSHQN
jgi:hypothetical protein